MPYTEHWIAVICPLTGQQHMLDQMVQKNFFLSPLVFLEWVSEHPMCLIIDALLYCALLYIIFRGFKPWHYKWTNACGVCAGTVNKAGDTLLSLACTNGHLDTVKYLVNQHHCDPKSKHWYIFMVHQLLHHSVHLYMYRYSQQGWWHPTLSGLY